MNFGACVFRGVAVWRRTSSRTGNISYIFRKGDKIKLRVMEDYRSIGAMVARGSPKAKGKLSV